MIDSMGVKLAQHYGASELPAVEKIDRAVRPEDETTARSFLQKYLPELDGSLRQAKTCIYTLSPDRHFIIDFHPESENLIFATGFSGHGFKFASLIGEMLSDLAEQGDSAWWIPLFRRDRLT
jgi:glycine/D-amino acid oxidase-like deaminating enzyme